MDANLETEDRFGRMVGENIASLRRAAGLSQEELAAGVEEYGVPMRQQTVVKIEKGQRPLRLREAEHIGFVLGVGIESLLSDKGETWDRTTRLVSMTRQVDEILEQVQQDSQEAMRRIAALQEALDSADSDRVKIDQQVLNNALTTTGFDPVKSAELGKRRAQLHAEFEEQELIAMADAAAPYRRYGEDNEDG